MAISIAKIPNSIFREYSNKNTEMLEEAILNGILLPDDATNGDVIQAVFSNALYQDVILTVDGQKFVCMNNGTESVCDFEKSWWESPYKAGDTDA